MYRWVVILGAWTLATVGLIWSFSGPALSETTHAPQGAAFAPDRLLVKMEQDAPRDALGDLNRRSGASIEERIPHSGVSVVDLPEGLSVPEAAERYEAAPNVKYAEPDYWVYATAEPYPRPGDPLFPDLYGLENTGQEGGTYDADVDAPEAWSDTTGSADTVVAVLDTGVDVNHEDLNGNIWTNPDEIPGNKKDDDHNGYVDDVHGYDFYHGDASVYDPDPVTGKGDAHGTHVAGTIAAEGNNGTGVTGVNWQAKIMVLKFLGPDGRGKTSGAIEALNYAVSEGVKISNNSWGGFAYNEAMLDAIRKADAAGHLFVSSAGNAGQDNDLTPHYPSSYEAENVIAVAASDPKDALAVFSSVNGASNYGATSVDLAAPGDHILGTTPGNKYSYYEGTSMAAPHVTGAAALVKSQNPSFDDTQIRSAILDSVDKKPSLEGKMATGGRLNVARALGVNTPPSITNPRPSKTKTRRPPISTMVRDAETDLTEANIDVYLDGRPVTDFSYDPAAEKLVFKPDRKLAYRRHKVTVVARDDQSLYDSRSWRFKVLR